MKVAANAGGELFPCISILYWASNELKFKSEIHSCSCLRKGKLSSARQLLSFLALRSPAAEVGGRSNTRPGVLLDVTQPKEGSGKMQAMVCNCVWDCMGYFTARGCIVLLMCVCAFLSVLVWLLSQWQKVTPSASGVSCPVNLPGRTPLVVSFTVWLRPLDSVTCDAVFGFFCLRSHPEQEGRESYITGSVTGSQNTRTMNMQTAQEKKKCLMWLNLKISSFAIFQAAALTLSAYFHESLPVSSILFLYYKLEERVSCLFHH